METKLDIKFRLKQRLVTHPVTGETVHSTRNVLITMRVVYGKLSMEFTTGYHINVECWDAISGFAISAIVNSALAEVVPYELLRYKTFSIPFGLIHAAGIIDK